MRVVVAEDSLLLRAGLVRVLGDLGFDVVGQAQDAAGLVRKVGALRPHVAIVDIRMPPQQSDEGLRAAEWLGRAHPKVGVLVLSQYLEPEYAVRLVESRRRGVGYLLKDRIADLEFLSEAVRRVAAGGTALDPQVVSALSNGQRAREPLAELTEREREILGLMAEGCSNQTIGRRLFITEKTIDSHVGRIFSKLGLPPETDGNRRVLAVLRYLRATPHPDAR